MYNSYEGCWVTAGRNNYISGWLKQKYDKRSWWTLIWRSMLCIQTLHRENIHVTQKYNSNLEAKMYLLQDDWWYFQEKLGRSVKSKLLTSGIHKRTACLWLCSSFTPAFPSMRKLASSEGKWLTNVTDLLQGRTRIQTLDHMTLRTSLFAQNQGDSGRRGLEA